VILFFNCNCCSFFFSPVSDVLTTQSADETTPFNAIETELELDDGTRVFKIVSNQNVTDILDDLFLEVDKSSVLIQYWPYTFPVLHPTTTGQFQPIQLAPNVWYLNTIESVASAMEGSIIAGRNVAMLIERELQGSQ
jgi:hypothetical protein